MAENTVTMEIIDSEQYKRANIRFNGKPSEEIREELKKEGWFYFRESPHTRCHWSEGCHADTL